MPKKQTASLTAVRVRFAPSPTGFLHIGGLRTALYNYLFAKKEGGTFILRIDDTDQARSVEGALEHILKTLQWVGLEWDEGPQLEGVKDKLIEKGKSGPYIQSQRLDLYRTHALQLVEQGSAYYCFCTSKRLEGIRAEQTAQKGLLMYDGFCKNLTPDERKEKLHSGAHFVIRLNVPSEGKTSFNDIIRNHVDFENALIDDQVLLKSDGFPTYHLAHVVDDHLMRISHVIRGEEWLPSTPKHILLYRAFGWTPPIFAHLPLLLNPNRSKLSKRQGDVAVEDYRKKGYLPEALVNFVALLGWNPSADQEIYTLEHMAKVFRLEAVNASPSVVNFEKLDWLNGRYLREKNSSELFEICLPFLASAGLIAKREHTYTIAATGERVTPSWISKVITLEKERMKHADEIASLTEFFFVDTPQYDSMILCWKKMTSEEAARALMYVATLLEQQPDASWNALLIEETLKRAIDENGMKTGEILWPLRVALSGREASPSPFDIAAILGKEKTLKRIRYAVSKIQSQ
ncbi:MAG: glutamate--tRNA ligase [Patescibacteria group bacterium]